MPSLMFIAEHWQDIAKPFVEAQLPGYDTYVMGGHLMFYEYPEVTTQTIIAYRRHIFSITHFFIQLHRVQNPDGCIRLCIFITAQCKI